MQQWMAQVIYETRKGPVVKNESYFLPTMDDVRNEVSKRGAYVLSVKPHERSVVERILARSSWWQIQLLRGIQFRSTNTSPGVALWKIIESEKNPKRQNILAPAGEALSQGLGVIDALRALNIFDHATIAILSASERANKLADGIPHAIQTVTQKRKNARAIMATMSWLAMDIVMVVQSLFWGKGFILSWFRDNAPEDPVKREEYTTIVGNLELLWNVLIWLAVAAGGFLGWCVISGILNKGKADYPTARVIRKIPLIGAYLRDLGFADSMAAAARMIRGNVNISEVLLQSADASQTVPEVANYWVSANEDLKRGMSLGAVLDRSPLSKNERMELATLSDLDQVATIMESMAELRMQASKTKHSLIVWIAFGITGLYLAIAFGSAIYALTVMNMSFDSMMGGLLEGGL